MWCRSSAMSDAIHKMVMDDGGTHDVKTVGGCVLKAKADGGKITLTDETGGVATSRSPTSSSRTASST